MDLCNMQRTLGSPSPLFPVPSAEHSPVSLLDCWGLGVEEGEQMEDNTGPRPGCRQKLAPWATPPPHVLPLLEMRKPPGVSSVELTAGKSLPQRLFSNSQGPAVLAAPARAPTLSPCYRWFLEGNGSGGWAKRNPGQLASAFLMPGASWGGRTTNRRVCGLGSGGKVLLFSSQKGGSSILGAVEAPLFPGCPDSEVFPSTGTFQVLCRRKGQVVTWKYSSDPRGLLQTSSPMAPTDQLSNGSYRPALQILALRWASEGKGMNE